MSSVMISGADLKTVITETPEECCAECTNVEGCRAWQHTNGDCFLKWGAPQIHKDWAALTNTTSGTMPSDDPDWKVRSGWYEISGFQCTDQTDMVVFYPPGDGPFPVVVFGHGLWGEVDGADDFMKTIADQGLIVIAPFSGKDMNNLCLCTFADDMIHALSETKAGGAVLHPIFARADWSSTGMFGHSRGAKCAPLAAANAPVDLNVAAVLVSSQAPEEQYRPATLDIPTMMVCGTDDKEGVEETVTAFADSINPPSKVFVDLVGMRHMEITHEGRLNIYMAKFLSCHVAGKEDDCEVVYGAGANSLCQKYNFKTCLAERSNRTTLVI